MANRANLSRVSRKNVANPARLGIIMRMEKQSVLERLAERFSECPKDINRDKVMSNGDVPNVMFTAGETLFKTISSKGIDLTDTPEWFAIEPKGTSPHHGNICHSWDLYWLTAIEWLAKNKPDSGITFPGYILHRVSLKERLYSGLDINDILHYWHTLSDEHLKRVWRQLARASEDACSYLASKDVRAEKPAGTEQKEIVEVKPGVFGITVNIKEIAKHILKCVCSSSKD